MKIGQVYITSPNRQVPLWYFIVTETDVANEFGKGLSYGLYLELAAKRIGYYNYRIEHNPHDSNIGRPATEKELRMLIKAILSGWPKAYQRGAS
jgi:hypothetical protein